MKKSWKDIISDAEDTIKDIGEKISNIDVSEILNSKTFRNISSLLFNGKYILGYSLLKYVVDQATEDSDSSSESLGGWSLSGDTLTAVNSVVDNVLLINDSSSSSTSSVKIVNGSSATDSLVLVGNTLSNLITGGSGAATLWGGGEGNNTLTGGETRDQFWYLGGGNDIVTNFVSGAAANSDVAVLIGGGLSKIARTGRDIAISLLGGNSINLQTNSSSGDEVILYSLDGESISGAKIADSSSQSLTYSDDANFFRLVNPGSLSVTDSADNNIWLDGSRGKYFSNVVNIDASSSTGSNTLAGNSSSNVIIAGSGGSSLWGGEGNSSDTLTGGDGADTFWFGKNNGNDLITNASSNDTVKLFDTNLENITSVSIGNNFISATFSTGSNLSIGGGDDSLSATFRLRDGSGWQYNLGTRSWQRATSQ